MAEITISNKRIKKSLPRAIGVDLTPMVDLGFLLITFFILTSSLEEPKEMKLYLPKDSTDSTLVEQSATVTFILRGNDSIAYYEGKEKIKLGPILSMRNIILQKKLSLTKNHIGDNKLTIIIKPGDLSTYQNFIDALDEVTIANCTHYFIATPEKVEL
jgi:biopolymer transport protein ExbD